MVMQHAEMYDRKGGKEKKAITKVMAFWGVNASEISIHGVVTER
jgi:hypothetical protein